MWRGKEFRFWRCGEVTQKRRRDVRNFCSKFTLKSLQQIRHSYCVFIDTHSGPLIYSLTTSHSNSSYYAYLRNARITGNEGKKRRPDSIRC